MERIGIPVLPATQVSEFTRASWLARLLLRECAQMRSPAPPRGPDRPTGQGMALPGATYADTRMKKGFLPMVPAKAFITTSALLLFVPIAHASEVEVSGYNPLPARIGDFALKVEPGVALPLTDPQSRIFKTGGGETIKALWVVNDLVDVGPSATFVTLPAEASGGEAGTAWTFGGSLRFRRPRNATQTFLAISPWADADVLYVRTGERNRAGFAAAAGLSVPIGLARVFWIGPFVRYFQIMQRARPGFDNNDAKILSMGVSLEVGLGVERERAVVAATRVRTVETETFSCPDRDQDGVPDNVDRCPDVAGLLDHWGCPAYKKLVIQGDKLQLKEKLYFAWDQAVLQDESFPVLDEVVQALNDNKGFRVQVEGHASSEGTYDHNQTLSEKRAEAVLDYLVAHGIDKGRLFAKGFGSSIPLDTNATIAGRENNRRVEFVVYFTILTEGSK
jgi:outer membrane protein OmpA-like peptidoglycan-associated protein